MSHHIEIVCLRSKITPQRDQAWCGCGWRGPVRLWVTDAFMDAERHRGDVGLPRLLGRVTASQETHSYAGKTSNTEGH